MYLCIKSITISMQATYQTRVVAMKVLWLEPSKEVSRQPQSSVIPYPPWLLCLMRTIMYQPPAGLQQQDPAGTPPSPSALHPSGSDA